MVTRDYVVEKVKVMPEPILKEVSNFIDFIESKCQKEESWNWLKRDSQGIEESNFRDYLSNLESYEDMLIRGEINWK